MTTRSRLRVWMGRLLRGLAAPALALLATFAASVSGTAAQPAADHGQARLAAVAVPAMGRPPLLPDDPTDPSASPRPGPGVALPPCAAPPGSVHRAEGSEHRHSLPTPAAEDCTPPPPAPTVAVQQPLPSPSAPPTGAPAHPATPRAAAVAVGIPAPASTPPPRAELLPLPILPPLWLTPSVVPVPRSYAAELAPTSVLVLGFGSVALASAVMTLRLLRRGR
jgi:hypothetical protein